MDTTSGFAHHSDYSGARLFDWLIDNADHILAAIGSETDTGDA